jgi:hypothetical protein
MSSKSHTYEECSKKAEEILEALNTSGFNGHDMMFIAVKMFEGSIYLVSFEATAAAQEAMKKP